MSSSVVLYKGKFLELFSVNNFEGVSEPWCDNMGVAILPYVIQDGEHYFLMVFEDNPLFNKGTNSFPATITGGCDYSSQLDKDVIRELFEESGIDVSNSNVVAKMHGKYYSSKSSIKEWYLVSIDLSSLDLDITTTYKGNGDGSDGEKNIYCKFINIQELNISKDLLALSIFAKMIITKTIMI